MKNMLWVLMLLMVMTSCSITKPTIVKDSTVIHTNYVDSVRWVDSTVYHHLYKEIYKDYADMLDTLNLEDSYSEAQAYLDTASKKLKGSIKTKDKDIPVPIKWKHKIEYRDSLVYKKEEVPVPYPVVKEVKVVPAFYKFCLWWFIFSLLTLVVVFVLKFT